VPELASRDHVRKLLPLIQCCLQQAALNIRDIQGVAYTSGPGLVGALLVGAATGRALAWSLGVPAIGIHHMEGHLLAPLIEADPPQPPFVALLVSGGHSQLVEVRAIGRYRVLGETLDDAAGEAFDKVARLLGLGYPGGPAIQKAAQTGNPKAFTFPKARLADPWSFSFSGVKTAVLRTVEDLKASGRELPIADLAASFQQAVVDTLFEKTMEAAKVFKASEIIVAGGVSANRALREAFKSQIKHRVHIPALALCTDNAAMIAGAAYYHLASGEMDELSFDVLPTWPLSSQTPVDTAMEA